MAAVPMVSVTGELTLGWRGLDSNHQYLEEASPLRNPVRRAALLAPAAFAWEW